MVRPPLAVDANCPHNDSGERPSPTGMVERTARVRTAATVERTSEAAVASSAVLGASFELFCNAFEFLGCRLNVVSANLMNMG